MLKCKLLRCVTDGTVLGAAAAALLQATARMLPALWERRMTTAAWWGWLLVWAFTRSRFSTRRAWVSAAAHRFDCS